MSNNILFNFEGHEMEVINFNGVALFNPYDVGECLDMNPNTVKYHVKNFNQNQVVKLTNLGISEGGLTNFRKLNNAGENFLTTSGVYQLIMLSRKPSAQKFKDWITDAVLPSIEKHGAYIPGNTPEQIVNNGMNAMSGMVPEDQYMNLVKSYIDTYDIMKETKSQIYLDKFKYLRTDKIYEGADIYYEIGEEKFKNIDLEKLLISLQFIVPVKYSASSKYAFDTSKLLSLNPLQLTYKGFVELCYNIETGGKLIYHLK